MARINMIQKQHETRQHLPAEDPRIPRLFFEQNYMQPVKIKMLKTEQPLKEPYTDYELQLLLKKPDVKKCSFREFRTWARGL